MKNIQFIVEILEELKAIQGLSSTELARRDNVILPAFISAGDGRGFYINKKIDSLITNFALQIKSQSKRYQKIFSDKDIIDIIRQAFGPAFKEVDEESIAESAKFVLKYVKEKFDSYITNCSIRSYCFPCTFFNHFDKAGVQIGPVRIEHRDCWLVRQESQDRIISSVMKRRLEKAFSGKKLRSRKPSWSSIQEDSIVRAIGSAEWICSVTVENLAIQSGEEKAMICARIAFIAFSLIWEKPSNTQKGLNLFYDGPLFQQHMLTVEGGNFLLASRKINLESGPILAGLDPNRIVAERTDYFNVIGKVLEYVISPIEKFPRSEILDVTAQALLWFHEACCERLTHSAIVKFAASLDALAGGKDVYGICNLLQKHLGLERETVITSRGETMKKVVEKIYQDGRSRWIHGTTDKFGYDWGIIKNQAECLARDVLVSIIYWIHKHPNSTDPQEFRSIGKISAG